MLTAGDLIDLVVDKPAAGGRMIARHEGQVVFVLGAIPGERVAARVDRVEKRLAFATAVRIDQPSSDRRQVASDPLCGGCLYAHIGYPRQLALKSDIIADAFMRIGRIPLAEAVDVRPSPEHGYRMRARLHVRAGLAGFYREGTHAVCDARSTGQLLPESLDAVASALAALSDRGAVAASVELSENIAADQRALLVDLAFTARPLEDLEAVVVAGRLRGCTVRMVDGTVMSAGEPDVADPVSALIDHPSPALIRRSPGAFFQANRYLLSELVAAVVEGVPPAGEILDLYAGVGLFAISLAASGREGITAVEGDPTSAGDLRRNAQAWSPAVRPIVGRVEQHLAARRRAPATIVIDPPRTGVSKEALDAILKSGARRIVYVSCDPPTMARDARRMLDSGFTLRSLQGFDLFPNTPHVEVVGMFEASHTPEQLLKL